MQLGDFTKLAKAYRHRTGYDQNVLNALYAYASQGRSDFFVAEVGAGTGKLTQQLVAMGIPMVAVEPNDAMRAEGELAAPGIEWRAGSGEETGLANNSADWLIMASSFHWTDPKRSLPEFARVLRQHGLLTVMWNPRYLESSELHQSIEQTIYRIAPNIQRRSSGSAKHVANIERTLLESGLFDGIIFTEGQHIEKMTKERYMGAWHSVNDIQAQAGPQKWSEILEAIEDKINDLDYVEVPYKTRAWTARCTK